MEDKYNNILVSKIRSDKEKKEKNEKLKEKYNVQTEGDVIIKTDSPIEVFGKLLMRILRGIGVFLLCCSVSLNIITFVYTGPRTELLNVLKQILIQLKIMV